MKSIMINALNDEKWVGGLYYKKNIVYSLLQNPKIREDYKIYIFTNGENDGIFSDFGDSVIVVKSKTKQKKIQTKELLISAAFHMVDYIYPMGPNLICKFTGIHCIAWIPDFQHIHYPDFFDEAKKRKRNEEYQKIADGEFLILSSQDCWNDFNSLFPEHKCAVEIVPFVSYIEKQIGSITKDKEHEILNKYELAGGKYVCIMNQFWKHKNHIVVFEAIAKIVEQESDDDVQFVFTGLMEDFRNPEYINRLKDILKEEQVANKIKILGFIDRVEQLTIMKNAEYVIQPSLFEGWGTVVEDAKVLDKTILLSDIPVHREQMTEKCVLFNPNDSLQLAELIIRENKKTHESSIKSGITEMAIRAQKYSNGFEKILLNEVTTI